MSRSAPPIIRLARLGRGRAEGAGEGGFSRAIQDFCLCSECARVMQSSPQGVLVDLTLRDRRITFLLLLRS
jgi:hypothetical protein